MGNERKTWGPKTKGMQGEDFAYGGAGSEPDVKKRGGQGKSTTLGSRPVTTNRRRALRMTPIGVIAKKIIKSMEVCPRQDVRGKNEWFLILN